MCEANAEILLQLDQAFGEIRSIPIMREELVVVEKAIRQEAHLSMHKLWSKSSVLEPAFQWPQKFFPQLVRVTPRQITSPVCLDRLRRVAPVAMYLSVLQPPPPHVPVEVGLELDHVGGLLFQVLHVLTRQQILLPDTFTPPYFDNVGHSGPAAIDFSDRVIDELVDDFVGHLPEVVDPTSPHVSTKHGLDPCGGHVTITMWTLLLENVGECEAPYRLVTLRRVRAEPGRHHRLEMVRYDRRRMFVLSEGEDAHNRLREVVHLCQHLTREELPALCLEEQATRLVAVGGPELPFFPGQPHAEARLDLNDAFHHAVEACLFRLECVGVLAVLVAAPDPLDVKRRLQPPVVADPPDAPLREPDPRAGLDLGCDPAEVCTVKNQRPEPSPRKEAADPSLDLRRCLAAAMGRRLREDQLLVAASSQLLHTKPELTAERLWAFLENASRLRALQLAPGFGHAYKGLQLDDFELVHLRLLLAVLYHRLLLLRGLFWPHRPCLVPHAWPFLHFCDQFDPRVKLVVKRHPRVVKPTLVRLAVVKELLAVLVVELHPIGQVHSYLVLNGGDFVLDLPEAARLHDPALIADYVAEKVVHGVPPCRFASGAVMEVNPRLFILVFRPPWRQWSVEGLLRDPEQVWLINGVDVETLDILQHLYDICLLPRHNHAMLFEGGRLSRGISRCSSGGRLCGSQGDGATLSAELLTQEILLNGGLLPGGNGDDGRGILVFSQLFPPLRHRAGAPLSGAARRPQSRARSDEVQKEPQRPRTPSHAKGDGAP
mmetsp:Transcript_43457/g.120250  ORF Transcript_43457/g.120250 Transcript_43457/m.120250 type:complete len:772 (-) Transcript_43457:45-2360(-)